MTDLRNATVAAERHNLLRSIISALAEKPERAELCRHIPGGKPVDPPEVWIDDIAGWIRLDGSWCSFDLGRGAFKPTPSEAVCIQEAAQHWLEAQECATDTGDAP